MAQYRLAAGTDYEIERRQHSAKEFAAKVTSTVHLTAAPTIARVSQVQVWQMSFVRIATFRSHCSSDGRLAHLEQQLGAYLTQRRFQTSLLTGFSLVALLMAAVGIYGLIQYSIASRTREIAVRIAVGNAAAFAKGRDLAAWLGLVPRQHSTGGKTTLRGISKRGNAYLRCLFIHGARSVCRHHRQRPHRVGRWLANLEARAPPKVVVVALANKLVRTAWAVLQRDVRYDGRLLANA